VDDPLRIRDAAVLQNTAQCALWHAQQGRRFLHPHELVHRYLASARATMFIASHSHLISSAVQASTRTTSSKQEAAAHPSRLDWS
jgi:hypothetical protein